jgi:exonuclease SbcC
MLLQRVNLKGFLAHRGVQENGSGGFDKPVELDFRGSPLWLIYGPNGSGKSSIFDAVTFALYNRVRDKGNRFDRFINDLCDHAEVDVELQVGEETYLVSRSISKRGRGTTNASRVHRLTDDGPRIEPGTENDVASWRERTVRLSYENFVCAAILRQGEADVFLKADPGDRKEQLMKLLDLDVYKRLGEAANTRKTQARELLRTRQTELDNCRSVSDEELEEARQRVKTAEDALQLAGEELEAQTTLLRDAEQAARWLAEINEKEKQQGQDAAILAEAARIEADAERHGVLGQGLPLLDALWRLRDALEEEEKKLATAHKQLNQVETDWGLLAPKLQTAKDTEVEAQTAVTEAQNKKTEIEREKAVLGGDLNKLQRIGNLERQIAEAEYSIAPFREILDAAEAIKQSFKRFQDLKTAGQKLSPLVNTEKKRAQAETELTTAQEVRAKAEQTLAEAQDALKVHERAVTQLDGNIEAGRLKLEEVARNHHTLREKLKHREGVEHADECPTCGSHLDAPETQARLQHEREIWSGEADTLSTESKSLEGKQEGLQADKKRVVAVLKSAQGVLRGADTQNASAHTNVSNAQRRLDDATRERDDVSDQAGEYASRIGDFDSICAEYKRLESDGVETRHQELLDARDKTSEAQTAIGIFQGQLRDELPQWSLLKRQALRDREAEIERQLTETEIAGSSAQNALDGATQALKNLKSQHETLARAHERLRGQCEDSAARVQTAKEKTEAELAGLPASWSEHAAAHDAAELKTLRDDFAGLADAPQHAKDLDAAKGRVNALNAQIETLRGNIEKLPDAHRIAPDVASAHKKVAEEHQKTRQTERDESTNSLAACKRAHQDYDGCRQKRDEAEHVSARADKLASAFGPRGLQAKIVSEAQGTIKALANRTLDKLSRGNWQIDLSENKSGTELEIIARDLGRGGKERPFECLSGGERFRVAISLAIAIGQSACGGQALNTLVIDEGFGALDGTNRGLLVDELHRLSEEVLQGGRIIIVSHQDDVCGEFDFRYELSRDKDGYARVQRYTPSDA